MKRIIEITEDKRDKLAELTEKVLKHTGKLMQCIEELGEEGHYNERMGNRSNNRYVDDEYYDYDFSDMNVGGRRESGYGNRESGYGNRYGGMGERRRRGY